MFVIVRAVQNTPGSGALQPGAARHLRPPVLPHIVGLYFITAVCGLLDAACYLSLGHVFAEIMTGNLLFLAFHIGKQGAFRNIEKQVFAIIAFVVGAAAGGEILRRGREKSRVGFLIEWLLLVAALVLTLIFHPGEEGVVRDIVVALLAVAMGMQNALIRTHGVPDLATNVMTLTMAALISEGVSARGRHEHWGRRAASIGIFAASAVIGAFLTTRLGPSAPIALSVAIFGVGLSALYLPALEGRSEPL